MFYVHEWSCKHTFDCYRQPGNLQDRVWAQGLTVPIITQLFHNSSKEFCSSFPAKCIWTMTLFRHVICLTCSAGLALHMQNHTLALALTHKEIQQICFSAAAAGFASYFLRYWFHAWRCALLFPCHYAHSAQTRAENSQHCLWIGEVICCR